MTPKPCLAALAAAVLLGGCQAALPRMAEPVQVSTRDEAPPGAAPGSCWGQDETPAVVETVTEQIVVQPPEIMADGSVARPAVYKTETRQRIVTPRKATWFETPCDAALTPEFTASLQRALAARGHYRGPATGRMDRRTRAAIRAYQRPQGLDSGMISLSAARQMGLIEIDLPGQAQDAPDQVAAVPAAPVSGQTAATAMAVAAPPAAPDTTETAMRAAQREPARQQAAMEAAEAAAREKARAEAALQAEEERAKAEAVRAEAARKAARQTREAELRAALATEKAARSAGPKPLPVSTESW